MIEALIQFRFCKTCDRIQLMERFWGWGGRQPKGKVKKGEALRCPGCHKECTA